MRSPVDWLIEDRARARAERDPCANLCTFATVDEFNAPQARTLVLREVDGQLAIFINATSPKQRQLATDRAAVCVYFDSLMLQYRASCGLTAIPDDTVQDSWLLRPDAPKKMDWYYMQQGTQSSAVADRATLLSGLESVKLPDPLHAPTTAVGYFLQIHEMERLDLGQDNGVHDRQRWQLRDDNWVHEVLVP